MRVRPPEARLMWRAITLGEASAHSTRSGQGGDSFSVRSRLESTGISGPAKRSAFTSKGQPVAFASASIWSRSPLRPRDRIQMVGTAAMGLAQHAGIAVEKP